MELSPNGPSLSWFWGLNSTLQVYMKPHGLMDYQFDAESWAASSTAFLSASCPGRRFSKGAALFGVPKQLYARVACYQSEKPKGLSRPRFRKADVLQATLGLDGNEITSS